MRRNFTKNRSCSPCLPSHALADLDRVKVDDLRGETLLLLEDGHCLRDQALEVCSRIRVNEAQDYRATSLETLRQMVAAGHGVTLLPELAAETPVGTARGLRIKPFARPAPSRTIGAVWRKSTTRGTRDRGDRRRRSRRHAGVEEMRRWMATAAAIVTLLATADDGAAPATTATSGLLVRDAWARATPPGAGVAAAYLTIVGGAQADRLVGARTSAAAMTQIHSVTESDGMARMRETDGIDDRGGPAQSCSRRTACT